MQRKSIMKPISQAIQTHIQQQSVQVTAPVAKSVETIVCIDRGYSQCKAILAEWSPTTKSHAIKRRLKFGSTVVAKPPRHDPKWKPIEVGGRSFLVGEDALSLQSYSGRLDTRLDACATPEFTALIRYAIDQLKVTHIDHLRVAIADPMLRDAQPYKENIALHLQGLNLAPKIEFEPQGVCGMYSQAMKIPLDQPLLYVDVGALTVLSRYWDGRRFNLERSAVSDQGVNHLLKLWAGGEYSNDLTAANYAHKLQERLTAEGYEPSPDDLAKVVASGWASEIMKTIISDLRSTEGVRHVRLAGGGSHFLLEEFINTFPKAEVRKVRDPEFCAIDSMFELFVGAKNAA